MRKTVTRQTYKDTKAMLNDGLSVPLTSKIMHLSITTVRRVKAARSYKAYVRANRDRYTPVNKYDKIMETYIETPQKHWWDKFTPKKKVAK